MTASKQAWGRAVLALATAAAVVPTGALAATQRFDSSFESGDPSLVAKAGGGLDVQVVGGPPAEAVLTAKANVGFTGTHSLRYAGTSTGTATTARLFDTDIRVEDGSTLSWLVFPRSNKDDLTNPANYVTVDVVFDDGSRLSTTAARDQHRVPATAKGQGEGRVLYPDQWNYVSVDLGAVAKGRRVRSIELAADAPAGKAFEGYIDDVRIGVVKPMTSTHPTDYVDTRRGSNANANFSRGNNFPAVAMPHGFNFWTPTTNAGSNWIYQYQERNGDDNRPRIEAFGLSHEPSPWMGERQTFQIMPAQVASGAPPLKRETRALSFGHDAELAHPDYYRVRFDNGIVTEIAPTDHAAMFRFTFTDKRSQLVFDNLDDRAAVTLDPDHRSIQGWSDVKSRLSTGATRLYFYAEFDKPVAESGRLTGEKRDAASAWFGFDTSKSGDRTVTMRIATSLIGIDQAKANLSQEIASADTFDNVRERARKAWDDRLGMISVEGASRDERTILYSNLYRLFLYPNSAYENTGSKDHPVYSYASPFSAPVGENTPTHTGARIVEGQPYVNNGFWDTYRTAWPAYVLFTPKEAGRMIDGFVQQYRDAGWIARWSSPGYADLMVGTSSDVAFADAWLKGVRNFDVASFYQSAIRNASSVSTDVKGAGRKGIERSLFNGYTDDKVSEGLSWSMDGYINDFAIGNLAAELAKAAPSGDRYASYRDDAVWYRARALGYANLFDPAVGFFVARDPAGKWRWDAKDFSPIRWGGDYTETNAWNMAFHAPQDGAGLAGLYGGREALGAKLDTFFSTPGNFQVGDYGDVIHEMLEARDVRMGQYGHSNQPSHHIIWMYDEAGQPWKTQDKLRDAVSRLYVGSEIGQGYPGDEDNGEMSAWWIFASAGFYPLRMGTPEYVIGAPHFPRMTITIEGDARIDIRAPGVSDTNRYVQSLKVNGQPWNKLTLPHELLAKGATLDFEMGPTPSKWGTGAEALPASLTAEGAKPAPLHDVTKPDGVTLNGRRDAKLAAVADNDSSTEFTLPAGKAEVGYALKAPATISVYTITSAAALAAPSGWTLQGSADGKSWTTLDERHDERFPWHRQTRGFVVAHPAAYARYRLVFDNAGPVGVAELELLTP
ncbi:alpha-1,2-mannosidase, putative [Luteibacter sp. UNC138MFCol5.1]|uniref:GH92 family glycosyl hydrolase n=1 Tax=Luteibacter sp. UNC138MFCol5.1 TaxID=1502774 RepID=UPI0008B67499|nr:GH92 family glycosyl hydrolase [Luteibacter sp. UNC138MFCol5.1]SEO54223.1 alpha-1,2-mannosidase, putative [Luteibacter sp. UNC138MFCol5.1]